MFDRTKDNARYLWEDSRLLRFCVKGLSCTFCIIHSWGWMCMQEPGMNKQAKRDATLTEINQRRRERQLKKRKRSVSVDVDPWGRKAMGEQHQSLFFCKLPAELRLRVYEMLLLESGDEASIDATTNDNDDEMCCITPNAVEKNFLRLRAKIPRPVALLRTCKRMHVHHPSTPIPPAASKAFLTYREAIDLIYSHGTFAFPSYKCFFAFSRAVPFQRLERLKRITIDFSIRWDNKVFDKHPFYRGAYEHSDFIAVIASMPALRAVHLVLDPLWWTDDPRTGRTMLVEKWAVNEVVRLR
ncbi:hypothetical protein P153DRAFT_359565 [Dothidotthia symphoricarpi CBS 119687]|uniref:DUF7730 domain-containing protein n=1 Tax=Dothidotthia symphoricarpi CBS 119687 TaxID=1392245 RepID=A0A6A6A5Z6_9PLEO|nr:uncharacterized protein P153DRAFT_359565 [Dothidotthia symphoricarpi CBS 119687]KAF2126595.1 hypothetical protein P153DRAFT_359565 [Dothidotthia symphoricarpi CBS 119687]